MATPTAEDYSAPAGTRVLAGGRAVPLIGSAMGVLAASMGPDEYRVLKLDTEHTWPTNGWLSWSNSCVWDPLSRQVSVIATNVGTNPYDLWLYDVDTDAFAQTELGFNATGHGYDHNAMDPATGRRFFKFHNAFGPATVARGLSLLEADGNWLDISSDGTGANQMPFTETGVMCLEWCDFIGDNGALVAIGNAGRLAYWENPADGWTDVDTGLSDWAGATTNLYGCAQPALGKLLFGVGTNVWTLDSSLTITARATPESADGTFAAGLTGGLLFADPNSARVLAIDNNSGSGARFLTSFDDATNTWTPLDAPGGDAGMMSGTGFQFTAAPIPELGVVALMMMTNPGESARIALYKPPELA